MLTEESFLRDFKNLLSIDAEVTFDMDLLDIDEWDSFSAMSFLAMIDEKYGIKAEPFTVAEAVYVDDLYRIIKK